MTTLWRRTSLAAALAAGLSFSQAPEFAQQYRQRLGGAIDELRASVAAFDSDSRASGLTHDSGVARLEDSSDPLVRRRGARMNQETARLARLSRQAADLKDGLPLSKIFALAVDADPQVARGAFDDFEPALPLSADGAASAAIGFVGTLLALRLLPLPLRLRKKRAAEGETPHTNSV
ncbi:DUF2937 family protein [Rhodoblastus sp.]|uniref:DUF2937 family protein n=1 Tax=Rhodoblastus sp. TaxID=1962975 RepID=UPI003F96CD87